MTIFGWDASHYDGLPAAKQVVAERIKFMTYKAGGDAPDPHLGAWWAAMKDSRNDVLLGAYWVLRPDHTTSGAQTAIDFVARLDSQCPGWRDGPFILQADCERWYRQSATQPNLRYVRAFCNQLVRMTSKLNPVVYASAGQYGAALTGLGYPLWNARYPDLSLDGAPADIYNYLRAAGTMGWSPYSGQAPALWQFTSNATIARQSTCDASAFEGTIDELTALVAPGWTDPVATTISKEDLAAIAQAVASKFHTDLSTATSGLARDVAGYDAEIISGVVAAFTTPETVQTVAQAIAAAIPTNIAAQVADLLAQRLSA